MVSTIGAGGMGEVYRATDTNSGVRLPSRCCPRRSPRTRNACTASSRRREPPGSSITRTSSRCTTSATPTDTPYLVSELLEGESLRERLQRGPLGAERVVDFARRPLVGSPSHMARASSTAILKPDNLFITRDGRVKILDFGIAKLVQSEGQGLDQFATGPGTAMGTVVGTVAYMSPEQVAGRAIDQRSDLFSFGVVLYEMLTGRRPFAGNSPIETMTAVLHEDPAPLASSDRNIPPALARIVTRCLEKGPDERFQSASDLAFALQGLSDAPASPTRRLPVDLRSAERGWAGPSRGCCWRAWCPSRFGAPASALR